MNHAGDLLSAHVDSEATTDERRFVEEHLVGCPSCREELASITTAREAVRALPTVAVPSPATSPARRTLLRPAFAWAASGVAAAALAVGLAMAPGEPGTTLDLDTLRDQHTARVVVDPGISTVRGPAGDP